MSTYLKKIQKKLASKLFPQVKKAKKKAVDNYPNRASWRRGGDKFPPHHIEKTLGIGAVLNYISVTDVKGSIVECGVGKGVSIYSIARIARAYGLERHIFGFDSFQGFPEPTEKDKSYRRAKKGDWSDTSVEHVTEHFMQPEEMRSYFEKFIRLVPGYFENTMPKVDPGRICYLHLDCDLYESYRTCIEWQYPRLSRGGVVVYDEYGMDKFPGAKLAVDETLDTYQRTLFFSSLTKKYMSFDASSSGSESFGRLKEVLQLIKV